MNGGADLSRYDCNLKRRSAVGATDWHEQYGPVTVSIHAHANGRYSRSITSRWPLQVQCTSCDVQAQLHASTASNFELPFNQRNRCLRRRHNLWPTAFRFLISVCFCSLTGVQYGLDCGVRSACSYPVNHGETTSQKRSFRATRNDIYLGNRWKLLPEHLSRFKWRANRDDRRVYTTNKSFHLRLN